MIYFQDILFTWTKWMRQGKTIRKIKHIAAMGLSERPISRFVAMRNVCP